MAHILDGLGFVELGKDGAHLLARRFESHSHHLVQRAAASPDAESRLSYRSVARVATRLKGHDSIVPSYSNLKLDTREVR